MARKKNVVEETGQMDPVAFIKAVKNIVNEKGISEDVVFEAMELALATAYKKNFGSKTNVRVDINRTTGEIKVMSYYIVVDEIDEGDTIIDEEGNEIDVPPEINLDAQLLIEEAIVLLNLSIKKSISEGVTIKSKSISVNTSLIKLFHFLYKK